MYRVYTCIYAVNETISLRYTFIYKLFASNCLNSDLSHFNSGKPCNVFGMCLPSDPSIRDFPEGKQKSIQDIAVACQDIPRYDRSIAAHDKYRTSTYIWNLGNVRYRASDLRYRYITILKLKRSISSVTK